MHSPHAEKVETGNGSNASTSGASPPRLRHGQTFPAARFCSGAARRADRSQGAKHHALDFLKSIYEPYKKAGFKGQPYWEAKRFFVADLAEAIERDFEKAKKSQEARHSTAIRSSTRRTGTSIDQVKGEGGAVALDNLGTPTLLALFLIETCRAGASTTSSAAAPRCAPSTS